MSFCGKWRRVGFTPPHPLRRLNPALRKTVAQAPDFALRDGRPRSGLRTLALLLPPFLAIGSAGLAHADQWQTVVIAECFALDDRVYREHLSIRVFLSETGGGQLFARDAGRAPQGIDDLSRHPLSCAIDGRVVRFETLDHRPARMRGYCGLCEQTGFRLSVDGATIWETPGPPVRGDPVFKGTIDVDREMARVCTHHRPEDLGVDLRLPPDIADDWPLAGIVACRTYHY